MNNKTELTIRLYKKNGRIEGTFSLLPLIGERDPYIDMVLADIIEMVIHQIEFYGTNVETSDTVQ